MTIQRSSSADESPSAEYLALPQSIRDGIDYKHWLWLPDSEKYCFESTLCEPEHSE